MSSSDEFWTGLAAAAATCVFFIVTHPCIAKQWVRMFSGTGAPLPATTRPTTTTPRETNEGAGCPDALADLPSTALGVCRHPSKGGHERQQVWQIEFRTMDGSDINQTLNLGRFRYRTPEAAIDALTTALLRLVSAPDLFPTLEKVPPLLVLMVLRQVPSPRVSESGGNEGESHPRTTPPLNEGNPSCGEC